jgi:hypothetical protein
MDTNQTNRTTMFKTVAAYLDAQGNTITHRCIHDNGKNLRRAGRHGYSASFERVKTVICGRPGEFLLFQARLSFQG